MHSTERSHALMSRFFAWISNTPALFELTPPFSDFQSQALSLTAPENLRYQGNPRLGFIYQDLCAQIFTLAPRYQLLEQEIQLNAQGRTLGAVDFIVNDEQLGQLQHWEVAVKFYLLRDGLWYGPNAQDRLDKKLTHMLTHQLALSHHPQFIQEWPQYRALIPQLLLQGRLYINPFEPETVPQTCHGQRLVSSQIQGKWCYFHQWPRIAQPLFALDKSQWAVGCSEFAQPITTLDGRFIHAQSADGQFWFLVNDQWPYDAA